MAEKSPNLAGAILDHDSTTVAVRMAVPADPEDPFATFKPLRENLWVLGLGCLRARKNVEGCFPPHGVSWRTFSSSRVIAREDEIYPRSDQGHHSKWDDDSSMQR